MKPSNILGMFLNFWRFEALRWYTWFLQKKCILIGCDLLLRSTIGVSWNYFFLLFLDIYTRTNDLGCVSWNWIQSIMRWSSQKLEKHTISAFNWFDHLLTTLLISNWFKFYMLLTLIFCFHVILDMYLNVKVHDFF